MTRTEKNPSAKGLKPSWPEAVSEQLIGAERLFVLGVGNRGKGDDAAGGLCVRLLARRLSRIGRRQDVQGAASCPPKGSRRNTLPFELRALDAGPSPESVTGLIRRFRPTHVLIVDAALGGFRPGTIFIIDTERIGDEEISTHRIPLVHLISYLEESVGCRVILVGIEPQTIAWAKPVSPAVKTAAADLAIHLAHIAAERRS